MSLRDTPICGKNPSNLFQMEKKLKNNEFCQGQKFFKIQTISFGLKFKFLKLDKRDNWVWGFGL